MAKGSTYTPKNHYLGFQILIKFYTKITSPNQQNLASNTTGGGQKHHYTPNEASFLYLTT